MHFRSIGFLPLLMSITMGALFTLKFHRESSQTEYALRLHELIDETNFDETTTWKVRRENFYLALQILSEAEAEKVDLEKLLDKATRDCEQPAAYRRVLADSLLLNLEIAKELDLLTEENIERVMSGKRLEIGAGGFKGEVAVLDNTVPHRYSPELEMRYANLLLKPERIARRYPDRLGEGALTLMSACRSAEVMTETSYLRAMRAVRSGRS